MLRDFLTFYVNLLVHGNRLFSHQSPILKPLNLWEEQLIFKYYV